MKPARICLSCDEKKQLVNKMRELNKIRRNEERLLKEQTRLLRKNIT